MSQLQKSNIALNLEAMKIKSVVAIVCIWMCGTLSLSAAKPSAAERQQAATTMKALAESRDYTVRIAQAFPLKGASVLLLWLSSGSTGMRPIQHYPIGAEVTTLSATATGCVSPAPFRITP